MGMTPSDTPSSPSNYAGVATQGMNIQAPLMDGEIRSAFDQANRDAGAGVLYPQSARQAQTERLIMSPPGYSDFDIYGGTTAGWPADVSPDA